MTGTKCVYTPNVEEDVLCRPAQGACDKPEFCDGQSTSCPTNEFLRDVVCRPVKPGTLCDIEEKCDGTSATCPADQFAGSEKLCRAASDLCDKPTTCDATTADCPASQPHEFGHVCRESTDACDTAETCDGVSLTCPPDEVAVDGTTCDDADECTITSVCSFVERTNATLCLGERSTCNCVVDADCDDENDCTSDTCVDRECKHEFKAPGDRCNDGDVCTIADKCDEGGRCVGRGFCENDSECIRPAAFCRCAQGFEGLRCEIPLCSPPDLCGRGGQCERGNTCACFDNYEGERCEKYTGPTPPPAQPDRTPLRDIGKVNVDDFALSNDLGGGLFGWTVILIAALFLLLCIISLAIVGWLLKRFVVDSVDKEVDNDLF